MGGYRIVRGARLAAALASFTWTPAVEGQTKSPAMEARREGIVLLRAGLEAMGGLERLEALRSVRLQAEVTQYRVGQAARPDQITTRLGTSLYVFTRDLGTGAWYLESSADRGAPGPLLRVVNGPDDRFQHDLRNDAILEIPEGLGLEVLAERLPFAPSALLDAWRRSETVRSLPTREGEAATLTYADSAGRQVAFSFGDDGLLHTVETVERHGQLGDVVKASTFSDYRPVDGLRLPFMVVNTLGPLVTVESAIYDVALDAPVEPALLRRPEGVPNAPARAQPTVAGGARKVEEIVPGVYQILNVTPLYNVLLVRQDEEVFVIDAPGDEEAFEMVRDSARSVLGGRDITTLVLTHHHFDHTSNLWRYLQAGATVIAPAGHESFVRSVAHASRADVVAAKAADPHLETVHGRRLIGSGPNRFELIDAGPNPHADEILIAYFPEHKLLWVPDIYGYLPGFTPPPLLLSFADRLDALDLDVKAIATAHTDLSSVTELQDMVARARAGAGPRGGSGR